MLLVLKHDTVVIKPFSNTEKEKLYKLILIVDINILHIF